MQAASSNATDAYTQCVAGNAKAFALDKDVLGPVDAALAQCEPFLAAAAAELKGWGGQRGLDQILADYRRAHGHDPDLDLLLCEMVRGAGRDLAEQIVTNHPRQGRMPATPAKPP